MEALEKRWMPLEGWLSERSDLFWLGVLAGLGALIYLPFLGSYPFWDPWEPHYTQVAWEMARHDTWMNPWYRNLDNWWSKPALMLWMLRVSLGLFWDQAHHFADGEFAARLPFALSAIAGALAQFHWVTRLFGRRIGILAAVVLLTAPQYLVIGRQVMVDTVFVATYAAAMGYLAVGLFTERTAKEGDAPALAWWRVNYPFVAFWGLQALSMLAKGFVPQALAVLILSGYAVATFRWRDYQALVDGRDWRAYALKKGSIAVAILGAAVAAAVFLPVTIPEKRALFGALIVGIAGTGVFLGVFHDFPLSRHALHILRRMRATWGLALFFVVGAPWYVFMSIEHGWPFWNEFIFYHHLGRAAGTIDKPGNTFEYFIKQTGYALFPWSAMVLGAVWQFAGRVSCYRSIEERRNAYVVFATVLPFLFFNVSGTKFAHYIFPMIPMLGVLIAAALIWLGRDRPRVSLSEEEPPIGPEVPSSISDTAESPWWKPDSSRGDMLMFGGVSLICFGVVARDLAMDYRHFLRLFLYYYNRAGPFEYHPHVVLQWMFVPLGIAIGWWIFSRYVGRLTLSLLSVGSIVLACYVGWVTMPAMQATYSFEPFYHAYHEMAEEGEPIGQYNNWQQPVRSVIFLFQNRCAHLRNDNMAEAFLKKPGRKFILVDKNRLADLRRVARKLGKRLYIVFDGHPYGRMVSDEPNPQDARKAAESILAELPSDVTKVDANFDDKIRMLGWKLEQDRGRPGEPVKVSFYYEALTVMDVDWQIFVHGDGSRGGSNRIHLDHFPVEGLYGTSEWQTGEVIKDTFEVRIPRNYPHDWFILWTGWYRGANRLSLVNRPPSDGDNRVRGPRIWVDRE